MFDHVSIGVRNLQAAGRFYDRVLRPLGFTRLYDKHDTLGYGVRAPQFWLSETETPVPADPRSGLHICFRAETRDAVNAFHAIALAEGASDNGAPGLRPQYAPNYYGGFVIDPDGYRLEAVCYGE
ncbi:MAG TPA: VOC family protein [Ferrovibrio sp.]|jgi:catechol 2,3-dioxygenase-like lactoylglutathione lyase family enzyme|uniref:VOC family protein n=1 Tax=Ferrovibrio sp. TaxID=1917215 RepID=UPI002B4B87C8|nr:VOC family protein [Ferrovibrio sp.]HLT78642.1 VOC family protein [Ferrovibrio sp.]